jgi:hypothetical protein
VAAPSQTRPGRQVRWAPLGLEARGPLVG